MIEDNKKLNKQIDDKQQLLAEIAQKPFKFKYANEILKKDPEVIEKALIADGEVLEFASDETKDDSQWVKVAIDHSRGAAVVFASPRLLHDKSLWLSAFSWNGLLIGKAPAEIKSDPELVLRAVSQYGSAILSVDRKFLADPVIVKAAVRTCRDMVHRASDEILTESFVLELLEEFSDILSDGLEYRKYGKLLLKEMQKRYNKNGKYFSKSIVKDFVDFKRKQLLHEELRQDLVTNQINQDTLAAGENKQIKKYRRL